MPEYSPIVVLFISMHLISLFLVSALIFIILRTGPYITKWILFQLCICLLVSSLSSLPPIMTYGNDLEERAFDSPMCIILNKFVIFVDFPLKIFPAVLSAYLWFAVVRFNYKLEQRYFWYLSGIVWALAIASSIYLLILNSKEKHWGVRPGRLLCDPMPSKRAWLSYIIPTSMLTFISIIITVHSSFILFRRWRNFNQKMNRRTAIDLGYAVRLSVMSAFYSIALLASIIPTIIIKFGRITEEKITFLEFSTSLFGIMLFMIFGTTKSAAVFLPCCYYSPNDRQLPGSIISQPKSVELDRMGSYENDPNFQTVTSRTVIIDNLHLDK